MPAPLNQRPSSSEISRQLGPNEAIKVAIVEDDRYSLQLLELLIRSFPQLEWVGSAINVSTGIELIEARKPEVIFLDINMPGASGFDLLKALPLPPLVVFTTAESEHAVKAFDVNAVDFLVKPILKERLSATILRLSEKLRPPPTAPHDRELIHLHCSGKDLILQVQNIVTIAVEGHYSQIMTADNRQFTVKRSLSEWSKILPPSMFLKINRNLLVQRGKIREIAKDRAGQTFAEVQGIEQRLPISRRCAQSIISSMKPQPIH